MKFYDTNALLELMDKAFEEEFYLSSKSIEELENIKVSQNKDSQIKYQARKVCHLLDEYYGEYNIKIVNVEHYKVLEEFNLPVSNDNLIIAGCYLLNKIEPIEFITNDIACRVIARDIFGLESNGVNTENNYEDYKGFKIETLGHAELADLYENPTNNTYECIQNQYLIVEDFDGNYVEKFKWTGFEYLPVKYKNLKSEAFGIVKPYQDDIYQQIAIDALQSHQIVMLKGSAGTGKSYLAMAHLFNQLEKHKINKIIIFCNTIATMNSAKLGYLPGTKDEKLLDSQIGNMLSAKLGHRSEVERLISQNQLMLLPMSDIRGFDTTGMNAGIYICEAQNLDISLMQLALQRIGEDCTCIIDGDCKTQVDDIHFAGNKNGMRKMSEVFKGQDIYAEVELQNIYRSKIAKIAELMSE